MRRPDQHDAPDRCAAAPQRGESRRGDLARIDVAGVGRDDRLRADARGRPGAPSPGAARPRREGGAGRRDRTGPPRPAGGSRDRCCASMGLLVAAIGCPHDTASSSDAMTEPIIARQCPAATGTRSRTGASSATSARASASCTRASAACASCARGRTTGSCSPPTAAPRASASTRSRRSRSTTSCPARRCCPSARRAATSPASSARTGTSRRRAPSTACRTWPRRRRSPRRRSRAAAARSPSPTTTR